MKNITTNELKNLMDSEGNFVLLDCRSCESYDKEHIKGAICIGWSEVGEKAEKELPDKNTLIITSCSGVTCDASTKCYANLEKLGYKNVREYAGGLSEWKASGYETVKEEVKNG